MHAETMPEHNLTAPAWKPAIASPTAAGATTRGRILAATRSLIFSGMERSRALHRHRAAGSACRILGGWSSIGAAHNNQAEKSGREP